MNIKRTKTNLYPNLGRIQNDAGHRLVKKLGVALANESQPQGAPIDTLIQATTDSSQAIMNGQKSEPYGADVSAQGTLSRNYDLKAYALNAKALNAKQNGDGPPLTMGQLRNASNEIVANSNKKDFRNLEYARELKTASKVGIYAAGAIAGLSLVSHLSGGSLGGVALPEASTLLDGAKLVGLGSSLGSVIADMVGARAHGNLQAARQIGQSFNVWDQKLQQANGVSGRVLTAD